jgi:hypothetical protein
MLLGHSSSIQRQENVMSIERTFRNLGFALASLAIVAGLSLTIEYEPLVSALAR